MDFKKRLLINIGISLGICAILVVILFFLKVNIASRVSMVESMQGDMMYYVETIESLASLIKDSEVANHRLPELESILPTRDQLVSFLGDLGIIARQSNIGISSSLGQENPATEKDLGSIDFLVAGQGSFDDILSFLNFIKNSRYSVKIKSLDLSRQDGGFKVLLAGQVFSF